MKRLLHFFTVAVLLVSGSALAKTLKIETSMGSFSIELYEEQAPISVANFMNYVNDGDFINSFFHRSVPGFVLQGGGFAFSNNQFAFVATDAKIKNEFSPGRSNVRGTLAMAKVGGDPDSATNQWFINLADNSSNLDNQNGGFTVFGKVLGDGMSVIDSIANLPIYNLTSIHGAFTHVPLNGYQGTFDPARQLVDIRNIEDISVDTVPIPSIALWVLGGLLFGMLGLGRKPSFTSSSKNS